MATLLCRSPHVTKNSFKVKKNDFKVLKDVITNFFVLYKSTVKSFFTLSLSPNCKGRTNGRTDIINDRNSFATHLMHHVDPDH